MVPEFEVGDRVQQRSLLTEQQATGQQGQDCLTAYTHRSESHFSNPRSCAICRGPNESYLNARRLANRARCEVEGEAMCAHDEQQNFLKSSEPGNVIHQRVDVVLR